MENTKGVIAWILSRKEGQQLLAGCMVLISIQFYVIVKLALKYDDLDTKSRIEVRDANEGMRQANDNFNNFLLRSNDNAQRMKDSLYLLNLRADKMQEKLKNRMK